MGHVPPLEFANVHTFGKELVPLLDDFIIVTP